MARTIIFAIIGITLLSLVVSHPMQDYKPRKKHGADFQLSVRSLPLLKSYNLPKRQFRQDIPFFSDVIAPVFAGLVTPLASVANGISDTIGNTVSSGISTITDAVRNRTGEDANRYVVPVSSVPYVYLTQRKDNIGGTPLLLPAGSHVPSMSPIRPQVYPQIAVPLHHPTLVHGNYQHHTSSHQIFIPLLPRPQETKEALIPVQEPKPEETVEVVEEPALRSAIIFSA